MSTRPDGSFVMTNSTIRSILSAGSPVPTVEIEGVPGWVDTERYDVTTKAPEGATRRQGREMLRNLLIDRLQLRGHVETRDRNIYALVVERQDGRLGPQLTASTLDCTRGTLPGPPQNRPGDSNRGCGMRVVPS